MKKFIAWIFMSLYCAGAFALPRPSQIEDALAGQHYAEARSMVAEVLREKPDSARAHLLNAYLLVHADQNKAAANAELQTATGLDKRGDVKSSALFGRVVAEIEMAPAARPATLAAKPVPVLPPAPTQSTFDWPLVLIVLAIAAIGLYLVLRRRTKLEQQPFASSWSRSTPSEHHFTSPPSAPVRPAARDYDHAYAAPVQASQPMGAFGTAASVAGGVVAGNVLSDALLHSHSRSSYQDDVADRRRREREEEERRSRDSWTPSYSDPSPVSTSTERSSFSSSSSSSDSWSSSSSYSSSDNSSSSDYGSSSSSDW